MDENINIATVTFTELYKFSSGYKFPPSIPIQTMRDALVAAAKMVRIQKA